MSKLNLVPLSEVPTDNQGWLRPAPPIAVRILAGKIWGETGGSRKDNGARDPISFMANAMATMLTAADMTSDDPAAALTRALVEHGDKVVADTSDTRHYYSRITRFDVDYHPNHELTAISEAAGLKPTIWPFKSYCEMDADCVSAKFGYGANFAFYYPLDDGRVLITQDRIPSRLLTWVVSAMDTVGMPDGFEIADWNWREYAASIGVKGDIPTCAESAKIAKLAREIAAATTG
jgi:hypothetical protein